LLVTCEWNHTPPVRDDPARAELERKQKRPETGEEGFMQITRNDVETTTGPTERFTGQVFFDTVAVPLDRSRVSVSNVHFTPGARTAWHTHPNGQTIYVTEGVALVQGRGGVIEAVHPGERVFFEPGEEHWHGATPMRFMTHLSIVQVADSGESATWGDHVSDEEYRADTQIDD
jgi:quercetin dioxygenase-like cupin family protein